MMTARLLVKSHKNGRSSRDGKSAAITLGIVSPMMTQKATMPPKALKKAHLALALIEAWSCIQGELGDGNCNESRGAKAMFHSSIEYQNLFSCR